RLSPQSVRTEATADFAKAANETLRRAKFTEARRKERRQLVEIAPGIKAHYYDIAGAHTLDILAHYKKSSDGQTIRVALNPNNGYALVQLMDLGRRDMGYDREREPGSRTDHISDERLVEIVDATENWLRSMNYTPTADIARSGIGSEYGADNTGMT